MPQRTLHCANIAVDFPCSTAFTVATPLGFLRGCRDFGYCGGVCEGVLAGRPWARFWVIFGATPQGDEGTGERLLFLQEK